MQTNRDERLLCPLSSQTITFIRGEDCGDIYLECQQTYCNEKCLFEYVQLFCVMYDFAWERFAK